MVRKNVTLCDEWLSFMSEKGRFRQRQLSKPWRVTSVMGDRYRDRRDGWRVTVTGDSNVRRVTSDGDSNGWQVTGDCNEWQWRVTVTGDSNVWRVMGDSDWVTVTVTCDGWLLQVTVTSDGDWVTVTWEGDKWQWQEWRKSVTVGLTWVKVGLKLG